MSLKHFSLFSLLLILSGCSLFTGTKNDFSSLYTAHIEARIESLRELGKDLGYMDSYSTEGSIRMMANIPAIFSGALSSMYDASVADGQDVSMNFVNPRMSYETLLASWSLEAKSLSLISKDGDVYFRYSGLLTSMGLVEPEVTEVLGKYSEMWLAIRASEIESSLSGASEEDILSYKISEAISKMTLEDVEEYLKRYPLWNVKNDLGMSGTLHVYEVELAKENIVNMFSEFTKKATGTDMTSEAKTELETSLSGITLVGKIGLDPKDEKSMTFEGVLTVAGEDPVNVSMITNKEKTYFSIYGAEGKIEFTLMEVPTGKSILLSISEGASEVVRVTGNIVIEKDEFRSLTMELQAIEQWLTVTLEHKRDENGNFDGKLNAWVGNLSWKGKIKNKEELESLEMNAAMMGSSMDLRLSPDSSGMLTGPLTVKSGDVTVISAQIGLRVTREEFTLKLDIASPDEPTLRSTAEVSITGKKKAGNGKIEAPKDAKSFQEFADAMDSVMPETIDPMMYDPGMDDSSLEYTPEFSDDAAVENALINSMSAPIQ